jgi:hypothetical protein
MDIIASAGGKAHILELPYDVMHLIFTKLEFLDKINAGMTCKLWDQLLKASLGDARHWDVDYDVDLFLPSTALTTTDGGHSEDKSDTVIRR